MVIKKSESKTTVHLEAILVLKYVARFAQVM